MAIAVPYKEVMMELGKTQELKICRKVDFGLFLGEEGEEILLPANEIPKDLDVDKAIDEDIAIEVFVMRDSKDRMIATTQKPKVEVGGLALLKVKEVTGLGAFLDWGLGKDLFLPYKEQTVKVVEDDEVLVGVYLDKSNRICSTMKVYEYLSVNADYSEEDEVEAYVYNINLKYGAFVAVDYKYHGLIQNKELNRRLRIGDVVKARVKSVRTDGKLDLSLRKKAYLQIEDDAKAIVEFMENNGGRIPYTDKASPEVIKEDFSMSKNEFKRAIGRLLKEGKIVINKDDIAFK